MKVKIINDIDRIGNYISKYLVKDIQGDNTSVNNFNFFEKRYSMSRSCIKPQKNNKELFPNMSLQEKYLALQSSGLEWVYNGLVSGEEMEIKL